MHLGLGNSQKAKRFRKFVTRSSTKFDGTDDVITTSADSTLASKTYSFWLKNSDTSERQTIFAHGLHYRGAFHINWDLSEDHGPIIYFDASSYKIFSDAACPQQDDGNWHHYLVVPDTAAVQNSRLWIDGEEITSVVSSASGAAGAFTAGIMFGKSSDRTDMYGGSIDEFAIFTGAQTDSQEDKDFRRSLYNNGQPTKVRTLKPANLINSNLAHWFRMGEGKLDGKSDGESNLLFDQGPNGGLSSEKATNGSFSADSDWTKDSSWTIAAGVASDNGTGRMFQSFAHGDKTYQVSFDVTAYTSGTARIQIGNSSNALDATSVGSFSGFITASGANNIYVNNSGLGFVGSIDNVSVKEVQNAGTINGPAIQADGGTELVTNGTFDGIADGTDPVGSIAGYTAYGTPATREISGGKLKIVSNGHNQGVRIEFPSFVTGATYKFSCDVTGDVGAGGIYINNSPAINLTTTVGKVEHQFVNSSGGGTREIFFRAGDNTPSNTTFYDNISVKEVTESVPKKTQNLPSAGSAKSMAFDGTDDFVDTGLQPDFIHTDATVSFWCNMANFSGFQALGCFSSGKQFYVGFNGTAAGFALQATGKSSTDISAHITAGLWHHIALVADGGTATYYVDGVARDTHSYTPAASANPDTNFYIGAIPDGSGGRTYHMEGSVSEVAIWDTALDGDAVKALYNAGQPTPVTTKTGAYDIYRDNLKAYYKMGGATNPAADGTSNLLFDQTNPGVGAENVVNGSFSTDSDWIKGPTWSIADGVASATESNSSYLYQNNICEIGKIYRFSFDVTKASGLTGVSFFDAWFENLIGATNGLEVGSYSIIRTAANTSGLRFRCTTGGTGEFAVDNVSVREVNGNTGTISGATIQTEAPKAIYALAPVDNKFSLNFDGTNDHLVTQVDATAQPNNESRYYSFWAKSSNTSTQAVFSHGGQHIGGFLLNSGGKPLLYMASTVYQYWNDTASQDDNAWHHWVVKIKYNDLTGCELWCDGVKQTKSNNDNNGSMMTYSTGIQIGAASQQGSYFNGSIDSFSIHEDLDSESIRSLFNRGRPIDISKSQGAYDLSDKALHWWRMGDAPVGQLGSSGDVLFQGLRFEGDEMFPTNPSSSDWAQLSQMAWDGSTLSITDSSGTAISGYELVLPVGATFRLTFDVTNDGTGNIYARIGDGNNAIPLSNVTTGSYGGVHTVTESGYNNRIAFVTNGNFAGTITNISVTRIRGQYSGVERVKADAELYKAATWGAYGGNVETFPNGTSARFDRPSSGGDTRGGYVSLHSSEALTSSLETGCVYKLQFDFLTDDSDAFPRYYDGSSYTNFSAGSGLKVHYFGFSGSGFINVDDLTADKFVQFSNLSVTKIGGAAVMTNMTTSDLQLDTPY